MIIISFHIISENIKKYSFIYFNERLFEAGKWL